MQARQEQVGRDGEKRHGRDLLSGWISPCLKDASWRLARWVARDLVLVLTKTGVSTLGASAEELRGGGQKQPNFGKSYRTTFFVKSSGTLEQCYFCY
jgi:hypothetical protein